MIANLWSLPVLLLLAVGVRAVEPEVGIDRIQALAKVYFRDAAEVPMDVAVTTLVTDKSGKVKRSAHSSAHMTFQGYSLAGERFSLKGRSGMFNVWALQDSIGGDLASFFAPLFLLEPKAGAPLAVRPPEREGAPTVVELRSESCAAFQLMAPGKYFFPAKVCGVQQFRVLAKQGGDLTFGHYTLESAGLPAEAKIRYLGAVHLLGFHVDVAFQDGTLPGDPKPFLWPKETITQVTTDKGNITITNRYSPSVPKK